jgi:Fe-S-cluster containining protein
VKILKPINKRIEKLYRVIDESHFFDHFTECSTCPVICARKKNIHWLLTVETERLKNLFSILKVKNAHFFEGGLCPLLKNKCCTIYQNRPLECRLNPISIYEIGDKLYWILYKICPAVKHANNLEEFISECKIFINKLESHIIPELRNEFREISRAIKTFDPLFHERDFIVLKKLRE